MKRLVAALAVCLLCSVPAMASEEGPGPKGAGHMAREKGPRHREMPGKGEGPERHRGKKAVATQDAPPAIGPYSQAIQAGPLLFISGSLGMEPATGQIAAGGVAAETEQSLNNLDAILKAAGATFDDIVKTTIFLTDMADFKTVNEIYAKRFASAPPARSTVGVKELPRNGKVEIEAIAIVPRKK